MMVPGMLALLMLMDGDADQSGMLMHPTMVPAMFGFWKAGTLEAQVSNFTPFLSQIQK